MSQRPAEHKDTVAPFVADLLRTTFDAVLSDPIRLRIQAALHGLPVEGSMTFTVLRRTLALSDGNLGAHLAVLVDCQYATSTVSWHGRRRTQHYAATTEGRAAFEKHVQALRAVIAASEGPTARHDTMSERDDPRHRPEKR